jgi:hypothetical protein
LETPQLPELLTGPGAARALFTAEWQGLNNVFFLLDVPIQPIKEQKLPYELLLCVAAR